MTAKEFLEYYEYTEEDQGQGYILTIKEICDLMEEYATQQVGIKSSTQKNDLVIPDAVGQSEQLICPKCENPYPHLCTDGSCFCDECGHEWAN